MALPYIKIYLEVFFMLGKYGIIYKNYLKEYKKSMYSNLKSKCKLDEHCYQRELELKELRERLEEQIKLKNPPPKTNEFIVMVRYNQMINEQVNELLLKEIEF